MSQSTNTNSLINLGLPSDPPENFKNPESKALYTLIFQAINNFVLFMEQFCGITQKDISQWSSLTPSDTLLSGNLNRFYVLADANLTYGQLINLHNVAGICKVQVADSAIPLIAHGFCNTSGGVLAGAYCEVILLTGIINIIGVVSGTTYFLAPAGAISNVAGVKRQIVGFGVAANFLAVAIDTSVI